MTMRNARTLLLLSPFIVALGAHAIGCSAFLDTESLQAGSGGAGGAAGTDGGGDTDAGDGSAGDAADSGADAEADAPLGKPCVSDLDCEDGNACTLDTCNVPDGGTSGVCNPSQPWTGLGIEPNANHPNEDLVLTADDVGVPVLVSDDKNIVLAAWFKNGTQTDITIRKYQDDAITGPTDTTLASVLSGFEGFAASPAMLWEAFPRRVRIMFPGDPTGIAGVGMFQWDFDVDQMQASTSQPQQADLAAPGYDTSALLFAPRLYQANADEIGMWIQNQHLWVHDKNGSSAVFTQKNVVGFTPMMGTGGEHAAIETTDSNGTSQTTEIWTRNATALTQIPNNQPGGARLGVASTAITDGLFAFNPLNVIDYSYVTQSQYPIVDYFAATCDATSCTSVQLPPGAASQPFVGSFPTIDSAGTPNAPNEREAALSFVLPFDDPKDSTKTVAALLGTAFHLTTSNVSVDEKIINPPEFSIGAAEGPKGSGNLAIVQTATTVTPTRQVFFAWVERSSGKSKLKVRRFRIKQCP
jgi:hypothetical protein